MNSGIMFYLRNNDLFILNNGLSLWNKIVN